MCSLYSITRTQDAMRRLFQVKRDLLGNFPGLPAVFPDTMAPIVHTALDGERELSMMCWGFPTPSTPKGSFWNYPLTGHVVDVAQTTRMDPKLPLALSSRPGSHLKVGKKIGESPRERHFLGSSWRDGVDIFVFNLRRASNRFLVAAVSSGKTTCLLIFAARHGR